MLNPVLSDPFPARFAPQRTLLITTGNDEFEILGTRYLVHIDRECGNIYFVRVEFVVPSKAPAASGNAQRGYASRNLHLTGRSAPCVGFNQKSLAVFL